MTVWNYTIAVFADVDVVLRAVIIMVCVRADLYTKSYQNIMTTYLIMGITTSEGTRKMSSNSFSIY